MQNGKGDKIRPMFIDKKKFDSEFDRIFKKNKEIETNKEKYDNSFGKDISIDPRDKT